MGVFRPCEYNHRLHCKLKKGRCPLSDKRFETRIEQWLLMGRTPKSIDFCTPFISSPSSSSHEMAMIRLADVAVLFDDDTVIWTFYQTLKMTYRTCREFRSAYWKWKKRLMPIKG